MHIYITGGSGVLGTSLVPRLIERGHHVTVASRRPNPVGGAETVPLDLRTGSGLEAIAGHDTVVHLASDALSSLTDVEGTRKLIGAAEAHGAHHVVGISIVGIDGHPYPYYRAKLQSEQIITSGGVPWSLVRATQFHELVPRFIKLMPAIGVVPVPIGLRLQPIDVADVAQRLVEIIESGPSGRVADLGGPEVMPARQMVRDSLRALELRRLIVPVPLFGEIGEAFRDGRMLTEHRSDGVTWSEWVRTLGRHRDRVGKVAMRLAGLFAITSAFMLIAPGAFHAEVAPFGEPNTHYIRDAATLLLPVVIGLWAAADRPLWRRPVFLIAAISNGTHLINHIVDIGMTDPAWLGLANVALLGAFQVALLWMWRTTTDEAAPVPGRSQALA